MEQCQLLIDERRDFFDGIDRFTNHITTILNPYIDEGITLIATKKAEGKTLYPLPRMAASIKTQLEVACANLDNYLQKESRHPRCNRFSSFYSYFYAHMALKNGVSKKCCLEVVKLRILMRELGHIRYLNHVEGLLEQHKQAIIQNLFPDLTSYQGSIHLEVIPEISETHNGGQVACKIIFSESGEERKFYYKPRSAEMDMAIIELFKTLNKNNPDQSIENQLATYKIMNLDEHHGSVWEFIEGEHPILEGSAEASSLYEALSWEKFQDRAKIMRAQLNRLESICKEAGIIDLHGANLLIDRKGRVILIDLECLLEAWQKLQGTGLDAKSSDLTQLTPEEKQQSENLKNL